MSFEHIKRASFAAAISNDVFIHERLFHRVSSSPRVTPVLQYPPDISWGYKNNTFARFSGAERKKILGTTLVSCAKSRAQRRRRQRHRSGDLRSNKALPPLVPLRSRCCSCDPYLLSRGMCFWLAKVTTGYKLIKDTTGSESERRRERGVCLHELTSNSVSSRRELSSPPRFR